MTAVRERLRVAVRALDAADWALLVYAIVYLLWVFLHVPDTPLNNTLADLAFLPLGLVVASRFVVNARLAARTGHGWRTQAGWLFLASAALVLWVSGSAWTYFVRFTGPWAAPIWIDALEHLQLCCVIAATLCFPARPLRRGARLQFALDASLIVLAAGTLAIRYGTEVVATWRQVLGVDLIAVRAVLDLLVFALLAIGSFHKRDAAVRGAMVFLLAANILVLTGNSALSSLETYRSGDPIDLLWFGAWLFKWSAARRGEWAYRHGHAEPEPDKTDAGHTPLPHIIVGAVFAGVVVSVATGRTERLSLDMYAAVAMTTLLVLRQVVELRENHRLFASQMAAEARFRSLVQHASDLVFVIDSLGRVTYMSPSAERFVGPPPHETMKDLVAPDDAEILSALLNLAPFDTEQVRVRVRAAGGGWREVEMVGSDLRADPAVAGIVLNGRDVTERNELERRLQHAQRLDAVSHLAGGLAHDFNNMLSAIRGYTELLQSDVQPRSAAAVDLASIQAAVDRAASVTRKLLAFSRKQTVQPVPLNLADVVRGLEPMLRQILGSRITLTTVCPAGLWSVLADQGQLEQVIINLATNARDAMAAGGALTVSLANRAGARHGSAADEVVLKVADTGTGMPGDVRERIFEPFFSTKARDKGMGLGLAMVHGIVTQSGGRIDVDSTEGRGSTFTVYLPRDERMPASATPVSRPLVTAGPRRILLVDDEPGVRTVVCRMLRRAGYDVVEAESGPAALAALTVAAAPFDILLTDLVMPGMHGRDLIAQARQMVPSLAVVCMTGYAGEPDAPDGRPASGQTIVTKPFSADTLLRALTTAFHASR